MEFAEMQDHLSKCLFTVIPSEWYDNLPNTLLESYAFKKCVVATDIGSLTENIINGETGLLFKYKDANDLQKKVITLFTDTEKAIDMGSKSRLFLDLKYNTKIHIKKLLSIFKSQQGAKK